ncbi:Lsr2 family protein [Microbacterium sp. NPDC016588]
MHLALSAYLVGLILDPEDREEGLENAPLDRFGRGDVEAVRAREQVKVREDHISVTLDLFVGSGELVDEGPSLHCEASEPSALAPYVDAARPIGSPSRSGSPRRGRATSTLDLNAIREWARANGHTVSDRGRIPATVIDAYKAAAV